LFKNEKVDVVINADETFVLFHMKDTRLIVPQGIKRVGTSTQVDNEKMGATVLISFSHERYSPYCSTGHQKSRHFNSSRQ
jgi:hypothetical protein